METQQLSLVKKLAEVMAEVERIPKRGWNDFHKYQYVLEADLMDVIRGKLAARKVMVFPQVVSTARERVGEKGEMVTDVVMDFTFVDGDSGEERTFRMAGSGQDKGDKGIFKAITGAEKYALLKAFMVFTGKQLVATGIVSKAEKKDGRNGPYVQVGMGEVQFFCHDTALFTALLGSYLAIRSLVFTMQVIGGKNIRTVTGIVSRASKQEPEPAHPPARAEAVAPQLVARPGGSQIRFELI